MYSYEFLRNKNKYGKKCEINCVVFISGMFRNFKVLFYHFLIVFYNE